MTVCMSGLGTFATTIAHGFTAEFTGTTVETFSFGKVVDPNGDIPNFKCETILKSPNYAEVSKYEIRASEYTVCFPNFFAGDTGQEDLLGDICHTSVETTTTTGM